MERPEPISALKDQLLRSHWPACINLARAIAEQGGDEAKRALIEALKAKRHHIRTAAIESLVTFRDGALADCIFPLLDDPAYETRMAAKTALEELTGNKVTTVRGE